MTTEYIRQTLQLDQTLLWHDLFLIWTWRYMHSGARSRAKWWIKERHGFLLRRIT